MATGDGREQKRESWPFGGGEKDKEIKKDKSGKLFSFVFFFFWLLENRGERKEA